jgi:uncharacterized protein involved in exopolysaccharide biosynthesis
LTTAPGTQYEDDLDLLRYGRFLRTYWLLLVLCAVAGGAAAFALSTRVPLVYRATATLAMVPPTSSGVVALTPVTARGLVENLTLIADTLNELDLQPRMTPQAFVRDVLTVHAVPSTNLLRIGVALPDPSQARLAAASLAGKAADLSRRIDQEGAVVTRDALKAQAEEAARRLDAIQARLLEFQTTAKIDVMAADAEALLESRGEARRLAIELATEKARLASLEQELARQSGGVPASTAPGTALSGAVSPLQAMLQYETAAGRARVSSLERQWRDTASAARDPRGVRELDQLPRLQLELARLTADFEVTKTVYTDLAERHEEASSRLVAITPQLLLVDPPVQPEGPEPRRLAQAIILGGLVGLVLGTGLALVVNYRRAALLR